MTGKESNMFIGKYNKSVFLTYLGVAFSITGMYLALNGNITWAFIAYICASICDLFDGFVARKCDRTQEEMEFGVQIDSLADVISFVAFPVILGYSLGLTAWYHILIACGYAICGVIRLGYFNIKKLTNGCYSGLPVTCSIIIFLPVYCFKCVMSDNVFIAVYTVAMALTAFLFVFNFKLRKPSKKWYPVFTLAAIAIAVFLIINR